MAGVIWRTDGWSGERMLLMRKEAQAMKRILFCCATLLLSATWLVAAPPGSVAGDDAVPNVAPAKVQALAEEVGVPAEKVTAMRADGLGWGEVRIAILLAQKIALQTPGGTIGVALDGVLAQRAEGMGWGQIAKANGFKLGEVVGQGAAKKEIDATGKREKAEKPEKAQKADKPDKPDKPEKPDKPDKPERPEKPAKPDKPGKP